MKLFTFALFTAAVVSADWCVAKCEDAAAACKKKCNKVS